MKRSATDKPKIGRPATGQMPKRYFRMDADGWERVESAAKISDETTSEYVRRILERDSSKLLKKQGEE